MAEEPATAPKPPEEPEPAASTEPEPKGGSEATPKKSSARSKPAGSESPAKPAKSKPAAPKAPRRADLAPDRARLLTVRVAQDRRRPRFTRQQSYRYLRIGRDESWRKPRGLQSKQRRHYGYRSTIVSIGFRGPRAVRGLTPAGFRPVLVRTNADVERLDPKTDAALIARSVGTKRRLVLEETARVRGVHLLNPLDHGREET